jgi:predicted nuclease of predicted toxin-antitoxin system
MANPKRKQPRHLLGGYTPPKRKLSLCVDRDIPETVVQDLRRRRERRFRVTSRAAENMEDRAVWRMAIAQEAVLLTHDEDFWDDHLYPLRDSPGVLLVKGATESDISLAFGQLLNALPFSELERALPGAFWHSKIKASMEGYILRFIDRVGKPSRVMIDYSHDQAPDVLDPFIEAIPPY